MQQKTRIKAPKTASFCSALILRQFFKSNEGENYKMRVDYLLSVDDTPGYISRDDNSLTNHKRGDQTTFVESDVS